MERRKFKHEPPEQRRRDLIEAALSLIAEQGVRGATVREIAQRAKVTQGLIRHYFTSKEDLIVAAYQYHMSQMTDLTHAAASQITTTAVARLTAFVRASLTPPVVSPDAVAIWASFLVQIRQDAQMRSTHEQTYVAFRDRLEGLIADAMRETGRSASAEHIRQLAIASNAVIDGLWLEGGALPNAFAQGELPEIGLRSIGAIIGTDLLEGAKHI